MKKLRQANLILLTIFALNAYAEGNAEAGKGKSALCVACHGVDGNSVNPTWPNIAGQNEKYIVSQLKAFKSGDKGPRRTAGLSMQMYAMVAGLNDQDMADIAAYYASQTAKTGVADDVSVNDKGEKKVDVARGEAIYRGGNLDTNLPACGACHGPAGKGNPAAGFPAVAGQHAEYSYSQLRAFHNGEREGDPNSMMAEVVRKMSEMEMRAVSEYMQGLY